MYLFKDVISKQIELCKQSKENCEDVQRLKDLDSQAKQSQA